MSLVVRAAIALLLLAPTLTALPLRTAPRPQLCRASTARNTCTPAFRLMTPQPTPPATQTRT